MIGHVRDLAPDQRRELLALLIQERTVAQTDEEVLAVLSETLRRQLSLGPATDLAEGFRRRMIRIAEELGADRAPDHYDFRSDRAIAKELLEQVGLQAEALSKPDVESHFMVDFTKTFRTMSQERRAAWLREAAVAASTAETGEADAQRAADAARRKSSADKTAWAVFDMTYRAAREAIAAGAKKAAPTVGVRPAVLTKAAAPLGLVAAGAVAYTIRERKLSQQKAPDAETVQVRRERQATQAVVTTCAYILAAVEAT